MNEPDRADGIAILVASAARAYPDFARQLGLYAKGEEVSLEGLRSLALSVGPALLAAARWLKVEPIAGLSDEPLGIQLRELAVALGSSYCLLQMVGSPEDVDQTPFVGPSEYQALLHSALREYLDRYTA